MSKQEIVNRLKLIYDKLLLAIVLFGLFVSLILLIVLVGRERSRLDRLNLAQTRGKIAPKARVMGNSAVVDAVETLLNPFRIVARPSRMMVAELRIGCIKCGRPIPLEDEVCPFMNCGAPQPAKLPSDKRDSDLDGIPDDWELKYGLNPNLFDAAEDADGDGWTNLEEYLAGSDPKDPKSHPPPVGKLRVDKIGREPMPLSFLGVQILPDGARYQLKNRSTGRDRFVKMNDTIDGYTLAGFEPKKIKVRLGANSFSERDVSVLTVKRGESTFKLVRGSEGEGDIVAYLVFLVDGSNLKVNIGDEFALKQTSYKVVDIQADRVIVADVHTGVETLLPADAQVQAEPAK